ncbi:unnamed protein product [Amoebophrya sp. A120]|nr:unnamed protein product [Amoebophrya sp. A120]|eukprot:GSA120T00020659001.1
MLASRRVIASLLLVGSTACRGAFTAPSSSSSSRSSIFSRPVVASSTTSHESRGGRTRRGRSASAKPKEHLPRDEDHFDREKPCAICLQPMKEEDSVFITHVDPQNQNEVDATATQEHIFHRDCVSRWLATQRSCPICRDSRGIRGKPMPILSTAPRPVLNSSRAAATARDVSRRSEADFRAARARAPQRTYQRDLWNAFFTPGRNDDASAGSSVDDLLGLQLERRRRNWEGASAVGPTSINVYSNSGGHSRQAYHSDADAFELFQHRAGLRGAIASSSMQPAGTTQAAGGIDSLGSPLLTFVRDLFVNRREDDLLGNGISPRLREELEDLRWNFLGRMPRGRDFDRNWNAVSQYEKAQRLSRAGLGPHYAALQRQRAMAAGSFSIGNMDVMRQEEAINEIFVTKLPPVCGEGENVRWIDVTFSRPRRTRAAEEGHENDVREVSVELGVYFREPLKLTCVFRYRATALEDGLEVVSFSFHSVALADGVVMEVPDEMRRLQ